MKAKLTLIFLSILLLTGCSGYEEPVVMDTSETKIEEQVVHLWLFYNPSCSYCHKERSWLAQLKPKYPKLIVTEFDITASTQSNGLYYKMAAAYGAQTGSVPMTYIGDQVFNGFSQTLIEEMETYIQLCLENGCPEPGSRMNTD